MKSFIVAFIILCTLVTLPSQAQDRAVDQDTITVYVFLHESCLISQYYSLPLRELHTQYASEQIQFIGLFPNPGSNAENIQAFKEKYAIPFDLQTDHHHLKVEALGATVTPEVVVYNESQSQIIYQGRIDDAYARVGQRKRFTSSSELKDVLEALSQNQPVKTDNTQAVGCFIGNNKLN